MSVIQKQNSTTDFSVNKTIINKSNINNENNILFNMKDMWESLVFGSIKVKLYLLINYFVINTNRLINFDIDFLLAIISEQDQAKQHNPGWQR